MLMKSKLSLFTAGAALLMLSLAACGPDDSVPPPTVLSNSPVNGALGVAMNGNITATFSEAMDPSSITSLTVTLKQGTTAIAGVVTYAGVTATINPEAVLAPSTLYSASVTTGAKGLANNALSADYEWSFTTGAVLDALAPSVLSTNPADGAVLVVINRSLSAMFSEPMNAATLTADTFTLAGPGDVSVLGEVTYSGSQATFRPLANLAPDSLFHAVITTGIEDLAGNALASDVAFSFTTSASTSLGPDPVLLGQAGDYVILAKSGIDTVPSSAVTGNIGVSPIDSTAVTGFSLTMDPSGLYSESIQVVGQVRAADYTSPTPSSLTTAVLNMETAYTDAAGRPTPDFVELGAGEIGGMTLAPGLYKWGTGVAITTDVTLAGGPDDTWIFQIAGDVTQANGVIIHLSGGALPKNIFWQTFGQLSIGTTAHFEGVALVYTAIVLGTGASVNGRLLAQTAVTLDQNAVTEPAL